MRYLPLTDADRQAMLASIGAPSVDALFRDVPQSARLAAPLDLPDHQGEMEVERAMAALCRAQHAVPGRWRASWAPAPIATTCRRRSTT